MAFDEMASLLEKLTEAHGVSGYEGSAREVLRGELEPLVDDVSVDSLGNLIATKRGGEPVVMIASHMDEIGLMCKHVDDDGFIRFVKVGGWFDQTLLNQRVVVHGKEGPVFGVLGSKPPHRMKEEEKKEAVKAEDMFIDVGAKDKENAEEMGVVPGCTVTMDRDFKRLANDRVTSKAFDDRAGCVMMVEAMRRMDADVTVHAVGTVQEEVGLKGARTSAFGLDPDVALVTEVTISGDHPGIKVEEAPVKMDEGAGITVLDASGRGLITPQPVIAWLEGTAKSHGIPYQLEVSSGGTTDATAIHLTRSGIPSGVVSVPTRYIHSPIEVLSLKDLDACAELIARSVESVAEHF